MRFFVAFTLVCFFLSPLEFTVADESKDVPHPSLPSGAGKIADNAPTSFTKTGSGLQYRVLRGTEGTKPNATNTVKVHYPGWLDDGNVFVSSYQRGEPMEFPPLNRLPPWLD